MLLIDYLRMYFKHSCMNCKYLEIYEEYFNSDRSMIFDCELDDTLDATEYYYHPYMENDCSKFVQQKPVNYNYKKLNDSD